MKKFLNKLFSSEGEVSSKRFVGIISYFIILLASIAIMFLIDEDIPANKLTLLNTIIYTSAALLGISAVNAFSKNGNKA